MEFRPKIILRNFIDKNWYFDLKNQQMLSLMENADFFQFFMFFCHKNNICAQNMWKKHFKRVKSYLASIGESLLQ